MVFAMSVMLTFQVCTLHNVLIFLLLYSIEQMFPDSSP